MKFMVVSALALAGMAVASPTDAKTYKRTTVDLERRQDPTSENCKMWLHQQEEALAEKFVKWDPSRDDRWMIGAPQPDGDNNPDWDWESALYAKDLNDNGVQLGCLKP